MKASAETRLRRPDGKLKMAMFARTFRRLFQVVAVLFLVCKLCDSVGKYENGCVVCGKDFSLVKFFLPLTKKTQGRHFFS